MLANSSNDGGNFIRFQGDDMEAFEELYKKYWYMLYCVAHKQTSSPQDAEELVQALFEKIWKNRAELIVKNWGPFLAVSLRNLIIDFQRQKAVKRKFLKNYKSSVAENFTEDELNQNELMNSVEKLLHDLPKKTQTVFKLSRYENKSVKEIADIMQLTEKAVEYHITKSLKLLRHHLRNYLNIFSSFF